MGRTSAQNGPVQAVIEGAHDDGSDESEGTSNGGRAVRQGLVEGPGTEGFSIPAQLKLLREYARQQRLRIVREFLDVETAKQAGRGGFGEMLAFLKAHPSCRTILVEKTDRFYRNIKDWMVVDDLELARSLREGKRRHLARTLARPRSSCTGSRS